MRGTQLFVSLHAAGMIDLRARSLGTHMSGTAYFGAGGPLGAHYAAWINHVGLDPTALSRVIRKK